jgi:hypothetical protein
VHLPRKRQSFLPWRAETLVLKPVARETDPEGVVSSMTKLRSEQAGELAMDRHEDEPRPVSPALIEMLPSRDANKSRHELGFPQEIGKAQPSP